MSNGRNNETKLQYHRRRAEELKKIRQPWEAEWRTLAEYIEPTRLRIDTRSERPISRKSIVDSSGTFALQTLASGMHSGITSPARPWFKLSTFDPELKDFASVKEWLNQVERRIREVYQSSNIYRAFHTGYADLGQFGQSCGLLVEDQRSVVRMIQLLHGRFWIARDSTGRATTLYRIFSWSVQRIVERFGVDNLSKAVRSQYDKGNYDEVFDIWHAVEPRMIRDPSRPDRKNMRFLSNYWEDNTDSGMLLEESGFEDNPIIAPPWLLNGEDHYAVSPGQIAIGDVKMLQKEQVRKLEGIDKKVRPPMTGPTSMRNNPASLLPGALTYVDDPSGKGYRPAMEVNLQLSELREDIIETRDRVNKSFYADLFLMLTNMEGIQPRNDFEIAERKEEKLLALGPVLENVYNGQLEPTIDRTFAILMRRGELPPPPEELQETELKVEYTSMLAQAQKAVATGAIERTMGFVGNLASMKPDVLDRIDEDETVKVYGDMVGAEAAIFRSDGDVAKLRKQRAQEMQQAKAAEMASTMAPAAKQGADAAKVMSETADLQSGSGLLRQLGIG